MGDGSDGFGGDANFDGSMSFGDMGGLGNSGQDSFGGLGGPGLGDFGGTESGPLGFSFNDLNFDSPFNMDGSMSFGDFGGLGSTGQDSFGGLGQGLGLNSDDESFSGKLLGFLASKGTQAALNALGIPGMATSIAGIAHNASQNGPQGAGQGFGSLAGTLAGTAFGGPLGGFLGGQLGGALGGAAFGGAENAGQGFGGSNSSNGAGNSGTGGGGGLNDILQALGGAYMGNRATGQYNSAINSLNDLYSPNSPYAQMMRQQLERRDAAAGRRSQYGNREVELAAALANSQAQALTSNGYANLMKQRGITQNQGLNTLLALMSKGGPLSGIANKGLGALQGGLSSLFNNNGGDIGGMFPPIDASTGVDFSQQPNEPFDLGSGWGW